MSDPPQADPRAVPVVEDFGARMRRSRQEGPSPPAMLWEMSFSRSISTAPSKLELRISPARCRSFKALSCASTLVTCCRTRSPSATDFAMNLQPHVTDRAKQQALLVVHPPDVYHTVNSQKFYVHETRGRVATMRLPADRPCCSSRRPAPLFPARPRIPPGGASGRRGARRQGVAPRPGSPGLRGTPRTGAFLRRPRSALCGRCLFSHGGARPVRSSECRARVPIAFAALLAPVVTAVCRVPRLR
jgi:hypothetical protein